jgi:hypothetical protein
MQDKCFTRIRKELPCVDANCVPLKNQPPTSQQGRVAEIGMQNSQPGGGTQNVAPPPQVFQLLPRVMAVPIFFEQIYSNLAS